RDREVISVEADRAACAAARENLAARGLTARIVETDASTFAIPTKTAVVVLDPPRAGARASVSAIADRGARGNAPAVGDFACDPPTLGRDVGILQAAGWELQTLETFEMFPHTSHVETLAVLVPRSRANGPPSAEPRGRGV